MSVQMEAILNKIGLINKTANANYNSILDRVLKTTVEMLKDRGYNVNNDCRTVGDILYKIQESEFVFSGQNSEGTCIVYFHNEERVGVKQLRTWHEKHPDAHIIIVSLEGPTAFTKREADQHYKNVQFFTFKQLCVNITRHSLVPKHEKLSTEQVQELNIQLSGKDEWPKLYATDVISQYYNYKEGDIIRITRTIGYPEPIYFYRYVCNPPAS